MAHLRRTVAVPLAFAWLSWVGAPEGDRPHHHLHGSEHVVHDHVHLGFHEHRPSGGGSSEEGGPEEGRPDPWTPPGDRDDPRKSARFLPAVSAACEPEGEGLDPAAPHAEPSFRVDPRGDRPGAAPLALHRSPRAPPA